MDKRCYNVGGSGEFYIHWRARLWDVSGRDVPLVSVQWSLVTKHDIMPSSHICLDNPRLWLAARSCRDQLLAMSQIIQPITVGKFYTDDVQPQREDPRSEPSFTTFDVIPRGLPSSQGA